MLDDFDKWPCDAGYHDDCIGQILDPNGAEWGRCPCDCHKSEELEDTRPADWTEHNSEQRQMYDDYKEKQRRQYEGTERA